MGTQVRAPIAATAGGGGHRGGDLHAGDGRLAFHPHPALAWFRNEFEDQCLEIHQQAVRPGVVGAQGIVVEGGGIVRGQVEHAVVQQDVAVDGAHALVLDGAHQVLKAFQHQLGIAAALDQQIAVQHPILDIALGKDARLPEMAGPEQIEAGVSGDQLHDRSRAHRRIGLPVQPGAWQRLRGRGRISFAAGGSRRRLAADGAGRRRQRSHHHGDGAGWNIGLGQGLADLGWQAVLRRDLQGQHGKPNQGGAGRKGKSGLHGQKCSAHR